MLTTIPVSPTTRSKPVSFSSKPVARQAANIQPQFGSSGGSKLLVGLIGVAMMAVGGIFGPQPSKTQATGEAFIHNSRSISTSSNGSSQLLLSMEGMDQGLARKGQLEHGPGQVLRTAIDRGVITQEQLDNYIERSKLVRTNADARQFYDLMINELVMPQTSPEHAEKIRTATDKFFAKWENDYGLKTSPINQNMGMLIIFIIGLLLLLAAAGGAAGIEELDNLILFQLVDASGEAFGIGDSSGCNSSCNSGSSCSSSD